MLFDERTFRTNLYRVTSMWDVTWGIFFWQGDVIDSGQRPPFIKVFLYGSQSLCPFGASHGLYLALRATIRIIYCHAKTLGERHAARGRQPRRAGQFYRVIQFSRRMPWKRWKSLVLSVTQIISLFIAVQAIKRSKLSSHGVTKDS